MSDSRVIDDAELVRRMSEKMQRMHHELEHLRRDYQKLLSQRHHDVLCLAAKIFLQGLCDDYKHREEGPSVDSALGQIRIARRVADEAYPPPKAEGT